MKVGYNAKLLSFFSLLLATSSAFGKDISYNRYDLNNDGIKDSIAVLHTPLNNRVIILEEVTPVAKKSKDKAGDIVAIINVGKNKTSFDDVEINSTGGLSIFSGCDVCGRETTITEYKIAYRNG